MTTKALNNLHQTAATNRLMHGFDSLPLIIGIAGNSNKPPPPLFLGGEVEEHPWLHTLCAQRVRPVGTNILESLSGLISFHYISTQLAMRSRTFLVLLRETTSIKQSNPPPWGYSEDA